MTINYQDILKTKALLLMLLLNLTYGNALASDKHLLNYPHKPYLESKMDTQLSGWPLSAFDRWLEIDLYWFEHGAMEKSVDQFWDRYYPLMENVDGWKGVILNVGWISDYINEWHGDLNEPVKLPQKMNKYEWFKDEGQLSGTTLERMDLAKERFRKADAPEAITYEKWTYGDLKKLSNLIKRTAAIRYKMPEVKVGTLVLGFESIYGGDKSAFTISHPDVFINGKPNLLARLSKDRRRYGAYSDGIPEGTPYTEFFGKQWGSLSKALSLDVIVLRDGYLGTGVYERTGPYGKTAPADPDKVKKWSNATADLVRQTKISNPGALVIGYSSAVSAVADWRVNCFDLETIAKEGYLDAWIDQTWAGAWNEVGQRANVTGGFWNWQMLGWTYQLSYMLGHAAVLADTKVRHYFLTETFDAWESWDVIHNSQERLRWGIWAFSHAAVKKPDGLKMPAGSYISWCNQGKRLLSAEDVHFLASTTNAAIADAKATKTVLGPTLVYCRSAMEWQNANKPNESIGEWIDEQAGSLIKWSVPILSITRTEYLPDVESDLFIFQTPAHLKAAEKTNILNTLNSGKPCAVFASPAGGMDKDIAATIGISTKDTVVSGIKYIATTNYQTTGIFRDIPNTFPVFQPYTTNVADSGTNVIYSVTGSPCLTFTGSSGKNIIYWNAPELSKNLPVYCPYGESLDQVLGSPAPFVLTARLINESLKNNGYISVENIEQYHPAALSMWQLNDGSYRVMTGNLEEGINHKADLSVETSIILPPQFMSAATEIKDLWSDEKRIIGTRKLNVLLQQAQTKLFELHLK